MSDGADLNGETQAASAGGATVVAGAAGAATGASASAQGVPAAVPAPAAAPAAAPLPAGAVPFAAQAAVAAPAAAQAAAPHANHPDADCKPKKKVAAKDAKPEGDDDQGKVPGDDEDQNLSQQVDTCVFPVTGEAAAPAAPAAPAGPAAAPEVVDEGGGISSGLLIGAGVLAAAGLGALVLGGKDKDKNGAPTAAPDTGAVNEGASLSGTVAANDTDPDNDPLTFTVVGTPPAGFTLNSNGTYTFDAANAAYNTLAAGQTQQVVINYNVSDGKGGTAASTLTITVTGTNDAPVAVDDTASGVEDTEIRGNVGTNDTDVDAGATRTFTVVGTAPAGFVLNADGSFVLDTRNAAYQNLREGQTQDVVVNYQISDGQGGVDTGVLTIRVTGRAEQVNLDVDTDNNLITRAVFDAGATDFAFTDDDDVANTVVINNFGADDFITFDAPFNGPNRASFASTDFDGDGVANDLVITTNKGGVVSDIVIRNVVDANVVITDEASAEAAVAGADNFRTTTQVTIVNQSLDVDNDSNLTSRFTLPVAANTATFVFSDDDDIANTVRVADFGADDTLIFDAAVSNVSFANIDADGDGLANDLAITVNKSGVVSDIILANSVNANSVIFNEATAEAAIGNGVDNFQFSGTVAPPPPPPPAGTTAVSLDVDNDNNLNTARLFDAGTDGFRFTDDADVANTAQITNFGANDRIVFEAGADVSFSGSDTDNDGLANDLVITVNRGGVVSDIVIKNVIDPNAVVFNEVTANAAIGGGIDYFSFA